MTKFNWCAAGLDVDPRTAVPRLLVSVIASADLGEAVAAISAAAAAAAARVLALAVGAGAAPAGSGAATY